MRAALRCAVVLVWTALLPSLAFAQASITGIVKDTSGAVLPGVTVEAASPGTDRKGPRRRSPTPTGATRSSISAPEPTPSRSRSPGFNTVKREGVARQRLGGRHRRRRTARRLARGDDHGDGRSAGRGRHEHDAAARAQLRGDRRAAERAQLLRPGADDSQARWAAATTSAARSIQDVGQSVTCTAAATSISASRSTASTR